MPLVPPTTTAVRPLRSNKDISGTPDDDADGLVWVWSRTVVSTLWRRGLGGLLRLVVAGLEQMRVHRLPCGLGVARADRLVDSPVHLGGVAQVTQARARGGIAAPLVVERRDHLDQRRDDRVPRRGGDSAVEVDVVDEKHAGIVERREEARDFVGQRGHLIGHGALGRKACRADLENSARFVHLFAREAMERRQEAQGLRHERRGPVRDVRARAVARLHDPHRRQGAKSGADGGPADPDMRRQIALGGQTVAAAQLAPLDEAAHVRHHLLGAAFRDALPGFSAERKRCTHDWFAQLCQIGP